MAGARSDRQSSKRIHQAPSVIKMECTGPDGVLRSDVEWSVMMVLRSVTQMQERARGSVANAEVMMHDVVGSAGAAITVGPCLYVS
jgi:hypothetical protein